MCPSGVKNCVPVMPLFQSFATWLWALLTAQARNPGIVIKVKMLVAQSCPTLCNPMDCSPPGSSVHGILQARIMKWLFPSPGIFPTWNLGLLHCRWILYCMSHFLFSPTPPTNFSQNVFNKPQDIFRTPLFSHSCHLPPLWFKPLPFLLNVTVLF